MPVCPRCGKSLSTNQALEYHLSKRKSCNSIFTCTMCNQTFHHKIDFCIHRKTCTFAFDYILKLVSHSDFNCIFLLDHKRRVLFDSGQHNIHLFDHYIHPNLTPYIPQWFSNPCPFFAKTFSNKPVILSIHPYSDNFLVLSKDYHHKYKLPGHLTPDF